jgi:transmembrane sensor
MSHEPPGRQPVSAADAAVRWFVRLEDDAATAEDWARFESWLAASPTHVDAYERVERTWVRLDELGPGVAESLDAPQSIETARTRRREPQFTRRAWIVGSAAMAAGVAAAVVGLNLHGNEPAAVYKTAAGQTRKVALADGSQILLNAGTRLSVRLGPAERRVEMVDGEAVFDVAHDSRRPFLISTGQRDVRVVGTRFNLRQREGRFVLTVERGLVEVRPSEAPGAEPIRVRAGERLLHTRGSARALRMLASPGADLAWTRGQLVYVDAPLSEVAEDLSRSLGTSIRVADPATGRIAYTGTLTLDDRSAILRRLQVFAGVRADRSAGAIVLRRANSASAPER